MKETKLIDIKVLLEKAKNSEHKESYRVLERSRNYRIGIGARLEPTDQPSFFFEILVYLCPQSSKFDLQVLEKNLVLLKELQARGYSLSCQDDRCISCETTVPPQNLAAEYENIKSITKRIFP